VYFIFDGYFIIISKVENLMWVLFLDVLWAQGVVLILFGLGNLFGMCWMGLFVLGVGIYGIDDLVLIGYSVLYGCIWM